MEVTDDIALLREYAKSSSEAAFATLVARHVRLVYLAALRQMRDPHLAEEVSQAVFIILAQKAGRISDRTVLSGWLFKTTRLVALAQSRSSAIRRHHEQEFRMQPEGQLNTPNPVWEQVAPLLDEGLEQLGDKDRQAVLLRYFEGKSLAEVGGSLGVGEDAARMRVSRALEKLHRFFLKRGVSSTGAILADAMATHSVQAVPATLAKTITAAAVVKGAGAGSSTLTLIKGTLKIMAWTKIKTAALAGAVALLAASTAWQKYEIHRAGRGLVTLHVVNAPLDEVIRRIERQSGQAIAWDRRLQGPVTLTVNNMPVAQALNQLILQSGAYWTVDYAVYESKSALNKLESALQEATELREAGWTNLSGGPLGVELTMKRVGSAPNGARSSGGSVASWRSTPGSALARMTVVVPFQVSPPGDAANLRAVREALSLPEGPGKTEAIAAAEKSQSEAKLKRGDPQEVIKQAVREGANDGVLAPERMLADMHLLPRIDERLPVAATPEKAEQIAKKARASWAIIYTLRQSPLAHTGITLVHLDEAVPPSPFATAGQTNFAEQMQQSQLRSLTLTPEQRALHAQTLANLKQNH